METQTSVEFYAKSDMSVDPSGEHFLLGSVIFHKTSVSHEKEHILNQAWVNDK